MSIVLNRIKVQCEPACLVEVVGLLNTNLISPLNLPWISVIECSIACPPGNRFWLHQVWAQSCIVRRWVWDLNMPVALVADEMGLGKKDISVPTGMIRALQTEKVVVGLLLTILEWYTFGKLVKMTQNNYYWISCEVQHWNLVQRLNYMCHSLLEIQTTPPLGI